MNIIINKINAIENANLNRDDSGAPKAAVIGGASRLYFSSQSMKRPVRLAMHTVNESSYGGIRTKCLDEVVSKELIAAGCPEEKVEELSTLVSEAFVGGSKKPAAAKKGKKGEEPEEEMEESGSTIGYFAPSEIKGVVEFLKGTEWDPSSAKDKKALTKEMAQVRKVAGCMDAVDIAIFGRMFASAPDLSVDAASCYSFAVSTHEATSEVDFFTAMDDLEKGAGSAHMGTKEFGSAVMGSTVVLNVDQLRVNLPGVSNEDIKNIVKDFIMANLQHGLPKGNMTSMLPNTLPQYAVVTVCEGVACAASFETPVKAGNQGGYLQGSIEALKKEVSRINSFQKVLVSEVLADQEGFKEDVLSKVVSHV